MHTPHPLAEPSAADSLPSVNLSHAGRVVGAILDKALSGGEVTEAEGTRLLEATGAELLPLLAAADRLRAEAVGDRVTFVVNRNINFTNVCVKHCGFCAFSRGHTAGQGYFLPLEELVRRAGEAAALGATEVCVQAGLAPGLAPWFYVDMVRAIKQAHPGLHLHACSPEEVRYGADLAGVSVAEYLAALKDAGLGSLPGTSAEVLVDAVRQRISPGRITVSDWLEVIRTAHRLAIPTTSTLMYGHLEQPRDIAAHLALLRNVQKETGGFTEFVPLGFVASEAPMARHKPPAGLRGGPEGIETLKLYAVARILLHGYIHNLQVSWVKEGEKLAQVGLMAGANDLGGTLINESISTAAGARHGQLLTPTRLRALARGMGRVPAERATDYRILRVFEDPAADPPDPLEGIADPVARFGSYEDLIARPE
ncbi:MAG: 5-amino-6-(D-ribitylamino)uracil--L-tyrosine 4-hydroxyphenyl transferase CofH, partial [Deltaproteobacteria bacterium]|nr:5-amino-6-(D-ribitylamino)uracil--L-tyrosine 4-hydroxyphenyl transferase CofH [Deltaproteobacteria bacterium]